MPITNEFIQQTLPSAKQYCLFILKSGPERNQPDADKIQWEHLRYLFQLKEEGTLSITCPIVDDSNVMGVGILNTVNPGRSKVSFG